MSTTYFFATGHNSFRDHIQKRLAQVFKLGEAKWIDYYLKIAVVQTSTSITLSQTQYIHDMIQRYGLQDANVAPVPLAPGIQFDDNSPLVDQTLYRSIIGSLLYAARCTRPDISYAVSFLSQFNNQPRRCHLTAAKRILHYLKGCPDMVIKYNNNNQDFYALCDSDWGNNKLDRKSFLGYVLFFGGAPIIWSSRKQRTVALSSCDAELIAASECARAIMFVRNFMKEIERPFSKPTICFIDNETAKLIIHNDCSAKRTKHIDIKYFHIRELVENKELELHSINTEENTSDIFTKGLAKIKFRKFRADILHFTGKCACSSIFSR